MNKLFLWTIVIAVALSASLQGASAQTVPAALSLLEALDMAVQSNPTLRDSANTLQDYSIRVDLAKIDTTLTATAEAKRTQGEIGADTNVIVRGQWTRTEPSGARSSVQLAPVGLGKNRGSLSLEHRVPLNRGKDQLSTKFNEIMDADSALRIQEKQAFLSMQATVHSVVRNYLYAVLAREKIQVQEKALTTAVDAATSARKRAEAGLIAELEVSRAEINVAQTRDQYNQQIQSAKAAVDNLMKSIGFGVGENPELTDSIPEATDPLPDLRDAVEIALLNRAELAVYDQRISDRHRQSLLKTDSLKPTLDAVAGYSTFKDRSGVLGGSIFSSDSLTIGLEYTITLDKRIITAEKEISERDLALFADLRAYEMEKIAAEVRDAYRSVEQAKDTLEILQQNLSTTLENLRLAQRMVEEGLSSNREVLEAQNSVTRVESGILSAKLDLYMAGLNLKIAMGKDLLKTVMQ